MEDLSVIAKAVPETNMQSTKNTQPPSVAIDSTFLKNYREDKIFSESVTNCYPYFTFINGNQSAIFSVGSDNGLYIVYENEEDDAGWSSVLLVPNVANLGGIGSPLSTTLGPRPFVIVKDAKNAVHIFVIEGGSEQRIWHVFQNDANPAKWPSGPMSNDSCFLGDRLMSPLQAILAEDGNIHLFFRNNQSQAREIREIYQQNGKPEDWFESVPIPLSNPGPDIRCIVVGKDSNGGLQLTAISTSYQLFLSSANGSPGKWNQSNISVSQLGDALSYVKYLDEISSFCTATYLNNSCYAKDFLMQVGQTGQNYFDLPGKFGSHELIFYASEFATKFGFIDPKTSKIGLIVIGAIPQDNAGNFTTQVYQITQNADTLNPDDPNNTTRNTQNIQHNWNFQQLGQGKNSLPTLLNNLLLRAYLGSVVQDSTTGLLHVFFIDVTDCEVLYLEQGADGWMPIADLGLTGTWLEAKVDADGLIELFVLDGTQGLPCILRRGEDGAWQKEIIEVKNPGTVQTYDSFYVNVTLSDANNAPLPNQTCDIWADSPIAIKINGKTYHVDTTQKVTVSTNAMSQLTLEMETFNLGAPAIYLSTPTMDPDSKISILVQEDIQQQLNSATTSGTALLNVQKPDGTYLVSDPSIRGDATTVNAVAEALNQMTSLKNANVRNAYDGQPKIRVNGKAGAYYHPPGDKTLPGQLVSAANAKPWKLSFENGKAVFTFLTQAEFDTYMSTAKKQKAERTRKVPSHWIAKKIRKQPHLISPDSWWDDIVDWFEEAWDDVTSGIAELATIVMDGVNAVVNLVIDGVTYALDFVIDTVEKVVDAVVGVLAKIKVFIQDVIQWLEFIFDWDDILLVKEACKFLMNQALNVIPTSLAYVNKTYTQPFFTGLQADVDDAFNFITGDGVLGGNSAKSFGGENPETDQQRRALSNNIFLSSVVNMSSDSSNTPRRNFLISNYNISIETNDAFMDALNALTNVFKGLDGFEDFNNFVNQQISLIASNPDQIFTLPFKILMEAIKIIAKSTLQLTANLLNLFVQAISAFIEATITVLNASIDIPLLSSLYKFISGSDLTLNDLAALIIAIPTTFLYKIISGKAPLTSDDLAQLKICCSSQAILTMLGIPSASSSSLRPTNTPYYLRESNIYVSSKVLEFLGTVNGFFTVISSFVAMGFDLSSPGDAPENLLIPFAALRLCLNAVSWICSCPAWKTGAPMGIANSTQLKTLFWSLNTGLLVDVAAVASQTVRAPASGPVVFMIRAISGLQGVLLAAILADKQSYEHVFDSNAQQDLCINLLKSCSSLFKAARVINTGGYGRAVAVGGDAFLLVAGIWIITRTLASDSEMALSLVNASPSQLLSMTQQILDTQVRILMRLDNIESCVVSRSGEEEKLQIEHELKADTLYSEGKAALSIYKKEGCRDSSKLQEAMAKFGSAKDQYKTLSRSVTFFQNTEAREKVEKRIKKTSNEGKYAMSTLAK